MKTVGFLMKNSNFLLCLNAPEFDLCLICGPGIKGSRRPDGVLRRTLLRRPPDHPCAHLREPFQGEEILLRSALRPIRDCCDLRKKKVQLYSMYMYVQCVHVLPI